MPATIVLLHGATLNGRMWDPIVSILSPVFTILTPDLPGHGKGRDGPFAIDRAVREVAALMARECPMGAIVAGDSLGGYTAMALAAAHPDLVKGLVLAGCTAEFTGLFGWIGRVRAHLVGGLTRVLGAERMLARTIQQVPKTFPSAPLDAILAGGLKLEAWPEAVLDLAGRRFLGPLARYPGPILAVNGENDRPNRKAEPGFLKAFPQAKLVVFAASPHGVTLWDPRRFGLLVRDFAHQLGPDLKSS
jgi:pimeloyl-ACP methyl ester carboxylesterase